MILQEAVYINPKNDITDKVIKAMNAASSGNGAGNGNGTSAGASGSSGGK